MSESYNPFAEGLAKSKLPPKPPAAELSPGAKGILQDIDEELAKPNEETTMRLASASVMEKTMPHRGMEAARRAVESTEDDEEIVEGELIEEDKPELEGFQTEGEIAQEHQARAQEAVTGPIRQLGEVNPSNPASVKEGTTQFLNALLGSEDTQRALEQQLNLPTGKINLERKKLATYMEAKIKRAAQALRSGAFNPAQVAEELKSDALKLLKRM